MTIMALAWLVPTLLALAVLLLATTKKPFLTTRIAAEVAAGLLIAGFPFMFITTAHPLFIVCFTFLQLGALLLAARLIFGRLDPAFVFPSTQRNCFILCILLGAGVAGWAFSTIYPALFVDTSWILATAACLALLVHLALFVQRILVKRHFRLQLEASRRPLKDLPTVSVCIPARNEDHALTDCLVSVLASDYPKLEVIVLDDCSQDKTSQIIRSFAHDGVRFIQGELPAVGWLGKNQARQTLAEHASGDFLLFLDVDTRVTPDSISQLIDFALDSQMQMVSVLPQNRLGLQPGAVFATLRFYWQQVLPISRWRVPVASQAWVITASAFKTLGGFESVAQKITPEASFARRLGDRDSYRFIASHAALGITTAKHWASEVSSAIRHLYPTYKRQPLFALGAAAAVILLFVVPPVTTVVFLVTGHYDSSLFVAGLAWFVGTLTYGLVRRDSHPHVWLVMAAILPFTALQEAILIIFSLLQYEFGEVNWKGRNICYPVIGVSAQNRMDQTALPAHR